jgi:hypothetical protein
MLSKKLVEDSFCLGVNFTVSDFNKLAHAIALVLIQEFMVAKSPMTDESEMESLTEVGYLPLDDIEDIIARRLKPADTYHRDGLLFQLAMWLAAHFDLEPGDLVALPHSQGSAKGQDSIVVHRAEGAVAAVSICEDKATENPRKIIREDVWPEIKEYEAGGRRDELRSNVIATLGTGGVPHDEAARLIRGISWEGKRRYRVRVTVEEDRTANLFKGFDELVVGGTERRRGETMHLPDMRAWMNTLASKVEVHLRQYIKEN